jgi:hypothetical protein
MPFAVLLVSADQRFQEQIKPVSGCQCLYDGCNGLRNTEEQHKDHQIRKLERLHWHGFLAWNSQRQRWAVYEK